MFQPTDNFEYDYDERIEYCVPTSQHDQLSSTKSDELGCRRRSFSDMNASTQIAVLSFLEDEQSDSQPRAREVWYAPFHIFGRRG